MVHFCIPIAAALAALALLPSVAENRSSTNAGLPADVACQPRNPTIGVVDLDKARENYPKAIAEREKLQKLGQSFQERLVELDKHVDKIRGELSTLKPGSGERELKEVELGLALQRRKGMGNAFESEYQRAMDMFELMTYQDLEEAVSRVAKDRGVHIVLRKVAQDLPEAGGQDSLNAQQIRLFKYKMRAVWFAADEVDLTAALIKYLQVPLDLDKPAAGKGEADKADAGAAPKPAGNGNGGR